MARSLFLSPETVNSHAHNAMVKLGAHTRAHAVAIALVTGQIVWSMYDPKPVEPAERPERTHPDVPKTRRWGVRAHVAGTAGR